MTNCLWLTDLHVDRLSTVQYQALLDKIYTAGAEQIWLTGDIGDPPFNWQFLDILLKRLKVPIYFVLGNHDYYRRSIDDIRTQAWQLTRKFANAYYLTMTNPIVWEDKMLTGVDAWANTNNIELNARTWDAEAIENWMALSLTELQQAMNAQAQADAKHLRLQCERGITKRTRNVYLLTHVPPLHAAQSKEAKPLQYENSVFYSNALTDVLMDLQKDYPKTTFYIYSGHVHKTFQYQISENMYGYVMDAYRPEQNQTLSWIEI